MSKYSVSTVFRAIDKMSPTFTKMQTRASRLQLRMGELGSGASKNFSRMTSGINGMRTAWRLLIITMGIGAIARIVHNIGMLGDVLAKTSLSIQISAQSLAEWQFVANRLGVSSDMLTRGIQKLNRNLGELQRGTGTLFRGLSMFAPDMIPILNTIKDSSTATMVLIERMDRLPNVFQKTALAVSAFGRSGVDIVKMMGQGSGAIRDLIDQFRLYAGTISEKSIKVTQEYADKLSNVKASIFGLKMAIAETAFDEINNILEHTAIYFSENRVKIARDMGKAIVGIAKAVSYVIRNHEKLARIAKKVLKIFLSYKVLTFMFAGLTMAVKLFSYAMLDAITAGGTMTTVFGTLTASSSMFQLSLATLFGTVGGIVALVAVVLVGGFVLLSIHSERFRNAMYGVWVVMKKIGTVVLPFIVAGFNRFMKQLRINLRFVLDPLEAMYNKLAKYGEREKKKSEIIKKNYQDASKAMDSSSNTQDFIAMSEMSSQAGGDRLGETDKIAEMLKILPALMGSQQIQLDINSSEEGLLSGLDFNAKGAKQGGFVSNYSNYLKEDSQ